MPWLSIKANVGRGLKVDVACDSTMLSVVTLRIMSMLYKQMSRNKKRHISLPDIAVSVI